MSCVFDTVFINPLHRKTEKLFGIFCLILMADLRKMCVNTSPLDVLFRHEILLYSRRGKMWACAAMRPGLSWHLRGSLRRHCSTSVSISDALDVSNVGRKLKVSGWIRGVRKQKDRTFLDLSDGLYAGQRLQVVMDGEADESASPNYHSSLEVSGTLHRSSHPAQEVELLADEVRVLSGVRSETYPFGPRKKYQPEFSRGFPQYRAKMNDFAALLRLRNGLAHGEE